MARRAITAGVAIAGILLGVAPSAVAAATHSGLRRVTYLGYSFQVPRDWQVIDLSSHQPTCVRFDRHVVYVGSPSANQACPSQVVGTTEAMVIAPNSQNVAPASIENSIARQISVVTRRLEITATFGLHPAVIDRILSSAHLTPPVANATGTAAASADGSAGSTHASGGTQNPQVSSAPPGITNFRGSGFDTCTAPSQAAMTAWRRRSPYGAVGIYIGGSDKACAQPNLTASWVKNEAAQGWHFIPLYVGPQAAFGELAKASGRQGAAAAIDAAHQAKQLGFGSRTPLYYDMEAYSPSQSGRALRFLSAWTARLHALGYDSGVYSSSSSGIADLAHQYGRGRYAMPDVIYDALWNGQANTNDPVFGPGEWVHHHRVHQYRGNITRTYGGITMNIDRDHMNVELPTPAP
jgi:hypothetical protein